MKPADIIAGSTYIGGKNGELRTVLHFGSTENYIVWGHTAKRLPLGGFIDKRCTSRISFAKWAKERCK